MLKLLQNSNFSQRSFPDLIKKLPSYRNIPRIRCCGAYVFVIVAVFELFDGYVGTSHLVLRLIDYTVRARVHEVKRIS